VPIRRHFRAKIRAKFDPRDYLEPAREAAKKICLETLHAHSACEGRRARSTPGARLKSPEKYKSGELASNRFQVASR